MENNYQETIWSGDFGKEYTERNISGIEELDKFYIDTYGVSRTDMNKLFLDKIDKNNCKILEVGCNIGNQLRLLQNMGFRNLYGIELQNYAVEKAKKLTSDINIIQASANDIPFRDEYFDLVFTSGVLIHIDPKNIKNILKEIYRCSKNYIWGFEYYSDSYEEVNYRGNNDLLWKTDYSKLYLNNIENLTIEKSKKFKYINSNNEDMMFLLKK